MLIPILLIVGSIAHEHGHHHHHHHGHHHHHNDGLDIRQTIRQEVHVSSPLLMASKPILKDKPTKTATATIAEEPPISNVKIIRSHVHIIARHQPHGKLSLPCASPPLPPSSSTLSSSKALPPPFTHSSSLSFGIFPVVRPSQHSSGFMDWYNFLPSTVKIVKEGHLEKIGHPQSIRRVILNEHRFTISNLTELFDRYQAINFLLGYASIGPKALDRAIASYRERAQCSRERLIKARNKSPKTMKKLKLDFDSCTTIVNLLEQAKKKEASTGSNGSSINSTSNHFVIDSQEQIEKELCVIKKALRMHKRQTKSLKDKLRFFMTRLGHDPHNGALTRQIQKDKDHVSKLKGKETELLKHLSELESLTTETQKALEVNVKAKKTLLPGSPSLHDLEKQLNQYMDQISQTKDRINENESELDRIHHHIIDAERQKAQNESQLAIENTAEAAAILAEKSELEKQASKKHQEASSAMHNAENLSEIARTMESNSSEKEQLIRAAEAQRENVKIAREEEGILRQQIQNHEEEINKLDREKEKLQIDSRTMNDQSKKEQLKMLQDQSSIHEKRKRDLKKKIKAETEESQKLGKDLQSTNEKDPNYGSIKSLSEKLEETLTADKRELNKIEIEIRNLNDKKSLYRSKSTPKIKDFADRKSRLEAFFKNKEYEKDKGKERTTDLENTAKCLYRVPAARIFFAFFPLKALFNEHVDKILDSRSKALNSIKTNSSLIESSIACMSHKKKQKKDVNEKEGEACMMKSGDFDPKSLDLSSFNVEKRFKKGTLGIIYHNLLKCPSPEQVSKSDKPSSHSHSHSPSHLPKESLSENIDSNHLRALIAFIMHRAHEKELPLKPPYTKKELAFAKVGGRLRIFLQHLPIILDYLQTGRFEVALSKFTRDNLAPSQILREYGIGTKVIPLKFIGEKKKEEPTVKEDVVQQAVPTAAAPVPSKPLVEKEETAVPETLAKEKPSEIPEKEKGKEVEKEKEKEATIEKGKESEKEKPSEVGELPEPEQPPKETLPEKEKEKETEKEKEATVEKEKSLDSGKEVEKEKEKELPESIQSSKEPKEINKSEKVESEKPPSEPLVKEKEKEKEKEPEEALKQDNLEKVSKDQITEPSGQEKEPIKEEPKVAPSVKADKQGQEGATSIPTTTTTESSTDKPQETIHDTSKTL